MLYTAFIFGLISSLHCIGMCGPIAMMLPVDRDNPAKKITQIITYHLGRLSAYGTIGLIFGMLGKGFFLAGFQQHLSIFIGFSMILIILIPEKVFMKYNFSKPIFILISKIKSTLGSQFRNKSYKSLFTIGLLNAFCLWYGLRCIIWRHCDAKCWFWCFVYDFVRIGNGTYDE